MKKNVTYYYDEDDAIPIKKRKKAEPPKKAMPEKEERISFTPLKNTAPTVKKASEAKPVAVKKAAEIKPEAAQKTREIKPQAAQKTTEIKPQAAQKTAEIKPQAAQKTEKTVECGRIQIAEIPYNRELGNPASVVPPRIEAEAKKAAKAPKKPTPSAPPKMEIEELFPAEEKSEKGKMTFKLSFIIYTAILLILSVFCVLYVRGLLIDYEAAQPENIVMSKIEEMTKAAEKGKIGSAVSLAEVMEKFSPAEDELKEFTDDLLASDITYKKVSGAADPDYIAFDILSDNYKMAHLAMRSKGKVAKLVIFTMDLWEIEEFKVTGFTMDVSLPKSLIVKNGDTVIEGVPAEDGRYATYSVSSLTMPEITFTDVMGNTKSYSDSGEYKFKEYLISIPSNYTLKGKNEIPLSVATLSDITEYKYVSEYCEDMPKTADYSLCIMADEFELSLYDNNGNEVDISELGNSFTLEGQNGSDTMPENIVNAPDPLAIAKQWSLFMTDDLGGKTHGFYTMEKNLIAESYLRDVAWEWATGVDITFTSPHTLAKNPFTTAEASNFVSYSDTCFSCDILLEKPMYITRANTVIDKIYSTFYFVYCDDTDDGRDNPHWAIADIQKIAE